MTGLGLNVAFFFILVDEQREYPVFETGKSKKRKKSAAMLESYTTEIIKKNHQNNQIKPKTSTTLLSNIFAIDLEQWQGNIKSVIVLQCVDERRSIDRNTEMLKKLFLKFGGQLCFGRNELKAEDYRGAL